jgi:1-acyl-sn-glycerol-3-phosphate acyltransferase
MSMAESNIDSRPLWGMRVRNRVRRTWRFSWWLSHIFFTILYGFRAYGRERLPVRGGYLLVANHQSFLDPIAVGLGVTRRETFFLGRSTLFGGPRWWNRFLLSLNCIPLDTSKGDVGALRGAVQLAREGAAIVVFPEGSRSFDGALQPFQPGVSLLMKRARVPVVPVGIDGAFDAYPRTQRLPRLLGQRVAVVYGDPIDSDDLMKKGPRAALERLAEEIEAKRLEARDILLKRTHNVFPTARLGDERSAVLDEVEETAEAA